MMRAEQAFLRLGVLRQLTAGSSRRSPLYSQQAPHDSLLSCAPHVEGETKAQGGEPGPTCVLVPGSPDNPRAASPPATPLPKTALSLANAFFVSHKTQGGSLCCFLHPTRDPSSGMSRLAADSPHCTLLACPHPTEWMCQNHKASGICRRV